MARNEIKRTAVSLAVAGLFAGGASQAQASGFALIEQNISGLGNAYAGAAASTADASTVYFNPAGMSALPAGTQMVVGAALIQPSFKFSDGGSVASGTFPAPIGVVPSGVTAPLGSDGGNAGSNAFVPNLYVVTDLVKDVKFGLGVSAPFGLKTEYNPDWMGRFQAIKSDIKTVNVNPSLSFDIGGGSSVGFGLNYQSINAEFTNNVNVAAAAFGQLVPSIIAGTLPLATAAAAAGPSGEATASVKASDGAWGYNLGGLFQLSPDTKLALAYRSEITYNLSGTVTFSNVNLPGNLGILGATGTAISNGVGAQLANGNVTINITMPESGSAALQHRVNDRWTVMGDATFTAWSRIKELRIVRDNGATLSNTPENFKDTWRLGVGATYRQSDALSLKMGIALDQSPINNTDRTARLPDQDRRWLAFGGQYRWSQNGALDVGFAHLFIKDATINQNGGNAIANGQLVGTYKSEVNIFGAQLTYRF